ncbi:hypothetical protein OAC87_04090 [Pseudomonadales bacterium]|nr:hypothetical protein [Pseudomonadales bacterium]
MAYQGRQPGVGVRNRFIYSATGGQTSFSGADSNGLTLAYSDATYVDVFLNGTLLVPVTDYAATTKTSVVLGSGAAASDIVEIVAYDISSIANAVPISGGTMTGGLTVQGTVAATSYTGDGSNLTGVGSPSIDDNGNATAMTIDSSENVLIGKTATGGNAAGMQIINGSFFSHVRDGGVVQVLNRKSSDGDVLSFEKDNTAVGSIGTKAGHVTIGHDDVGVRFHSVNNLIYPHNMTTGATPDGTISFGASGSRFKDLYLSGGIYLGGVGSANKLDDYEEGTFTPYIRINSGVEGITYASRGGAYTKVGNLVTVMAYMALSSKGTNVGGVAVDGLPFTVGDNLSQTSFNGTCLPAYFENLAINISTLSGWVDDGTTKMYLRHTSGSGNTSIQNTNNTHINNNSDFRFYITYMAA